MDSPASSMTGFSPTNRGATPVVTLPLTTWSDAIDPIMARQAVITLESGGLITLPELAFPLTPSDRAFLAGDIQPRGRKNISLDPSTGRVGGAEGGADAAASMLRRFSAAAETLVRGLLAHYAGALRVGRASFRPVEIEGRTYSLRQDDRLLHVDAFPTRPTGGDRILRLFTNLSVSGRNREWRVGGAFEAVASHFSTALPSPNRTRAKLYAALGLTKGVQSAYDQIMLALHDRMKRNPAYQRDGVSTHCSFTPGTTWLCFTDQVPHAALAGRMALEQTFYLPINAMAAPDTAPLRVLERLVGRTLAP
ncbi:MAG TPA: Kdo hydroxylase family protein [Rhodopila sp.]|nr:Kdo hydroxylase family protein [Rhodopila sp.]